MSVWIGTTCLRNAQLQHKKTPPSDCFPYLYRVSATRNSTASLIKSEWIVQINIQLAKKSTFIEDILWAPNTLATLIFVKTSMCYSAEESYLSMESVCEGESRVSTCTLFVTFILKNGTYTSPINKKKTRIGVVVYKKSAQSLRWS